jgi:hypothetical protein
MLIPDSWQGVYGFSNEIKKSDNFFISKEDSDLVTQEGSITFKPNKGYVNALKKYDEARLDKIEEVAKKIQEESKNSIYLPKKSRSSLNIGSWSKLWVPHKNNAYKVEIISMPEHIFKEHYDSGVAAHDNYMRDRRIEIAINAFGNNLDGVKRVWFEKTDDIFRMIKNLR